MAKWKLEDEIKVTSVNESDERAVKMSTNGGIDVLIPGRVYSDNNANSKKFIFIGFGNTTLQGYVREDVYMYIPFKKFESGIKKGKCTKDFKVTKTSGNYSTGFEFVNYAQKPRVMIEDHGELYSSSTFDNFTFDNVYFERKPCTKVIKIRGKKQESLDLLTKEEPATMETAVNIKQYVPKYKGLEVQVPGRVYMEQNTDTPYIFFGYCKAKSAWSYEDLRGYIYLDYNRYVRSLKRGEINADMSVSSIGMNGSLLHGLKIMNYPKVLIEDMGKLFDENFFNDVYITDGLSAYQINLSI